MAKNYSIEKNALTGWWAWSCNDGSATGSETTKREARQAAAAACGSNFVLTPPDIDTTVVRGHLATFTTRNLDGDKVMFSAAEISQEVFLYIAGLECAEPKRLKPADIVVALLKIWGLYRGGISEPAIRKLHFLTEDQFARLAKKQYQDAKVTVQDDDTIRWKL